MTKQLSQRVLSGVVPVIQVAIDQTTPVIVVVTVIGEGHRNLSAIAVVLPILGLHALQQRSMLGHLMLGLGERLVIEAPPRGAPRGINADLPAPVVGRGLVILIVREGGGKGIHIHHLVATPFIHGLSSSSRCSGSRVSIMTVPFGFVSGLVPAT